MTQRRVFTWGVFDLFHVGHARLLRRAKEHGDWLLVGICTDDDTAAYKRVPVIPLEQRLEIVSSIGCVDQVIIAPSEVGKPFYEQHRIDVHVQGENIPPQYDEGLKLGIVKFIGRDETIDTSTIIRTVARRFANSQGVKEKF
ncbi:MAG: adenylyltransferase/cytidyltransferase family protein [Planctomycetaceae bacterium]|jgi:cytidyltransferase-like protein|nr:adenylyltransferase/cytidyltransferase family protein [Planctomycetaceae bacterium]